MIEKQNIGKKDAIIFPELFFFFIGPKLTENANINQTGFNSSALINYLTLYFIH